MFKRTHLLQNVGASRTGLTGETGLSSHRTRDPRSRKVDFICFGITDHCFLQCKMCQKWKADLSLAGTQRAPATHAWKKCISSLQAVCNRSTQINFGGGEPLLQENICDIIAFSKTRGFNANVATNGYLLDEAMVERLSRAGLDSIIISLDSLKEEVHDYLRGVAGVYRRVMRAVELLEARAGGMYRGICCAIYEQNLDDVIALAEWVNRNEKVHSIYFMAAMQPNNTPTDPLWHTKKDYSFLWPKDTQKVCRIIDELIGLKKANAKITNEVPQLQAFKRYYEEPGLFVKKSHCNMASALHISSCGDIFLCYRWPSLGNIQTHDVADAWLSHHADAVRQDIHHCKENCHFLLNCHFREDHPFAEHSPSTLPAA